MRLVVQLRQTIAKTSFVIVTSLATDMISGKTYVDRNVDKISPKKNKLKPIGSSTVATEESNRNAAYITSKVKATQGNFEDKYNA